MANNKRLFIIRCLILAMPLVILTAIVVVEEILGRVAWFRYCACFTLVLSFVVLYIGSLMSKHEVSKCCVIDKILILHLVKIPIFVLICAIYLIGLVMVMFNRSGFNGVQ